VSKDVPHLSHRRHRRHCDVLRLRSCLEGAFKLLVNLCARACAELHANGAYRAVRASEFTARRRNRETAVLGNTRATSPVDVGLRIAGNSFD
jgi:hypothetical protein